jgi:hypothetical protein
MVEGSGFYNQSYGFKANYSRRPPPPMLESVSGKQNEYNQYQIQNHNQTS